MNKRQAPLLRTASPRSSRGGVRLVRETTCKIALKPGQALAPVAIWNGKPKRTSVEHDNLGDQR